MWTPCNRCGMGQVMKTSVKRDISRCCVKMRRSSGLPMTNPPQEHVPKITDCPV